MGFTLHNIASDKENSTAKRADSIKVLHSKIQIVSGFNERDFKREDVRLHIASIVSSLIAGEPIPALVVWTNPETGEIELVDGECRYWAYNDFAAEYPDRFDGYVAAIPYQGTPAQRKAMVAKSNSQLPLDPVQRGRVYLSLRDEHGMSRQDIAVEMNKSLAHVDQMILFASKGTPEVHQAVSDGKLSPTEAVKLVREFGAEAPKELERRIEVAAEQGKAKVTAKVVAPKAPSRPRVDMVVSNAVVLVNGLGKAIEDAISNGESPEFVEVKADALADLIMAVREMQQAGKALDADKQAELFGADE